MINPLNEARFAALESEITDMQNELMQRYKEIAELKTQLERTATYTCPVCGVSMQMEIANEHN